MRQVFKVDNYSREETIRGNTVFKRYFKDQFGIEAKFSVTQDVPCQNDSFFYQSGQYLTIYLVGNPSCSEF